MHLHRKAIYFPNLNGLRFIAAFFVVIHHVEQNKSIFNLPNYWNLPAINLIGKLGVVLFFVLSGYLITYLLLQEKRETQTIQIKNFYIRRMLRIWPLYYLIVALGLFVFPGFDFLHMGQWTEQIQHHFGLKVFMFLFFVPNLALSLFPRIPFAAQSWSIGVEEQFYFIWPFLVKKFKRVNFMLIGVIISYVLIKLSLVFFVHMYPQNVWISRIHNFWFYYFTIDCMALGGLAAYIKFTDNRKILKVIYHKGFQFIIYGVTITLLILGTKFPNVTYEVYAILFSLVIINLAGNNESLVNIEFKWLNYLGKISYGIYMYHILMSFIAIKICLYFNLSSNFQIYLWSIVLTLIVSMLSYEFFEKRFIQAKVKYSTVISGDNVKTEEHRITTPPVIKDRMIVKTKEKVDHVV